MRGRGKEGGRNREAKQREENWEGRRERAEASSKGHSQVTGGGHPNTGLVQAPF